MGIIASGGLALLRDRLPADVDSWVRWWEGGEWHAYDAPWEMAHRPMTAERRVQLRNSFLDSCAEELPVPRRQAVIATLDGTPLGWVTRYAEKRFPDAWWIGIDICADDHLNRGFGTEALRLWVDYLFTHSQIHRLGLKTYSFNARMIRVAEKAGFACEGAEREIIQWQDQWQDRIQFGLLRQEWAA